MFSGKAYTRAVIGYILVDSALKNMLIEDVVSLMEPQHIANLKKAFPRFSKRGLCRKELQ